jgi:hypothetical protein
MGEKLLPWPRFLRRMVLSALLSAGVVSVALFAGILGYHAIAGLGWIDSLLNASMILTGMGPVDPMRSDSAKVFASAYALFSGVVFLSAMGVLIAPVFHRFLHKFHLDDQN